MSEVAQPIVRITRPCRVFRDHKSSVLAVAVFPDGHRMVTGSYDKTLCLWDLKDGVVLRKMEGHRGRVEAVAVSRDGKSIASGDLNGEIIAWNGDTGESLTQAIKIHTEKITSLDFSPDGAVLATVSWDKTIELWNTKTWHVEGNPINSDEKIFCVRFSPSDELLAIATANDIQIWNPRASATSSGRQCIAKFRAVDISAWHVSLAWTPDGTRLFSAGSRSDSIIREWDTSTWKQVGDVWREHTDYIYALAVNSTSTLVASASWDKNVRLWRLSDRRTVAIFKASDQLNGVTFSMDGKHVLSGGKDANITEWTIPEDALLEGNPKEQALDDASPRDAPQEPATKNAREFHLKVLFMTTTARNACIAGDLPTAETMFIQEIRADGNNHNAYANHSFVLARKGDWDNALYDALRSVSIQPSLTGYISKGIALCGKMQFKDAMKAFDLAFMFTGGDLNNIHLLLLVKAVALFNANKHKDAMLRIQELAIACPDADTLTCHLVEAYLHVQLGVNALNDAHHNEAVDHFTAAINTGILSSQQAIHSQYEVFVVLFGWDLKSSWQTATQQRCHALLRAGRLGDAHEAFKHIMDISDEATKASYLDWSTAFKKECNTRYVASGVTDLAVGGDTALAASEYDRAIELYSAAIDLDFATHIIFANRCKAKLAKMQWEEALDDAQKVTELDPSSVLGYELKHAALHGGQRYDEAIEAFEIMVSKLNDAPDTPIQTRPHQRYITRSEAEGAIQRVIDAQMENAPPRLFNTSTGYLCGRDTQINTFKMSTEYKELLSLTMKHANLRSEHIQDVVLKFFQYAMLSHRWEGQEPLLHDIQGKSMHELNPVDGIAKLQSFCKVARDAGYRWAWSDTCCIDKNNNIDLQESVNSMFVWYRYSALTIIYLSDVPPLSKSGALAKSAWNSRGWTVQEFLAPKVVLFYQKDWTLYLDDRSPNHKESTEIMRELGDATGINARALIAFRPEMRGAREKLQWSSMRMTTLQEDIAYSLFGIFGVHLSPIYGEKKQNALGRLLQEIVAQSGDITCLDWVGKSSEFNSCLPANITSYGAPPSESGLPSLSEDEMQASISSLRDAETVELASQLYTTLDQQTAPRFAQRRLHLPCIIFTVTEVAPRSDQEQGTYFTYEVKADGLCDVLISTEAKFIPFSRAMPIRQKFLLIRPWDRNLLEQHDFAAPFDLAEDAQSITTEDYLTPPGSPVYDSSDIYPGENVPVDSESESRALRLLVRLRQPFSAFLLAQQWGGEYKRIAADHDIIVQVKDMTSVRDMMDVRMLEIL
ncbi:hypothetical protein K503DRAFT_868710 [Rhizopogon vinicolor AM-OR11-026]|uniref:Heterokaryon incompatibility domain-containing protein n=1 Tax=Rhizopogon vinicolor AM-OR11-026 TaxID=1314800 RepID=A0A1B7MQ80_9AGAM|nr:hypothetical protein K503DRAFT_868710 [Rhizopogon vinicolor AM-OR11-026]